MKLPPIAAILLLALSGCGMSEADKKDYKIEQEYARKAHNRQTETTKEFLELDREAIRLGMGADFDGRTRKSMDKMGAYSDYAECLKRYEKSGQKFVTAKTACTVESGINRY